jgi:hypothetical protein
LAFLPLKDFVPDPEERNALRKKYVEAVGDGEGKRSELLKKKVV